jgi:hypothetical protein
MRLLLSLLLLRYVKYARIDKAYMCLPKTNSLTPGDDHYSVQEKELCKTDFSLIQITLVLLI